MSRISKAKTNHSDNAEEKKPPTAANAASIHIGLNAVNSKHYGGWEGRLRSAEADAKDLAAIACNARMKSQVLLSSDATRANVLSGIRAATRVLKKGDLFFLSFSGNGGTIPNFVADEARRLSTTWCLYDGQLIDDELYLEMSRFAAGVRVILLSDCCHTATVTRAVPLTTNNSVSRSKMMPAAVAMRTYRDHKLFYDKLQHDIARAAVSAFPSDQDTEVCYLAETPQRMAIAKAFKPALILISGCQDNQASMDGEHNGAFTEQLLSVWDDGHYGGNYANFHAHIKARMPASQTPNLICFGRAGQFMKQKPFTV